MMKSKSIRGRSYGLVRIDDFKHKSHVYLLHNPGKVYETVNEYIETNRSTVSGVKLETNHNSWYRGTKKKKLRQ